MSAEERPHRNPQGIMMQRQQLDDVIPKVYCGEVLSFETLGATVIYGADRPGSPKFVPIGLLAIGSHPHTRASFTVSPNAPRSRSRRGRPVRPVRHPSAGS